LRTLNLGPDDLTVDPKLGVVLTPFADEERGTFDAIQRACSRRGYRCIRGDEEYTPGDILSHVLRLIVKARVVIANVGTRNPNVFYELGFAHAMGKQTILVSRSIERVPFDVRALRILIWSDYDQLQTDVGEMLLRTVAETQGSPVVPQGLQPPPTRHG
jgi:hypothetical protein